MPDGKTGQHKSTGLILPRGHNLGDHLAQWDDNLVPYVVVINSTDEPTEVTSPASSSGRLLTPKAATATIKPDGNSVLSVVPRGCVVLTR